MIVCKASVRIKPPPKIAENKVQYLHFRYLNMLATKGRSGKVMLLQEPACRIEEIHNAIFVASGISL